MILGVLLGVLLSASHPIELALSRPVAQVDEVIRVQARVWPFQENRLLTVEVEGLSSSTVELNGEFARVTYLFSYRADDPGTHLVKACVLRQHEGSVKSVCATPQTLLVVGDSPEP